jgi:hypothetical protein
MNRSSPQATRTAVFAPLTSQIVTALPVMLPIPKLLLPAITTLSFVISTGAQRSGEICGSAVLSWKCFTF